MAEQIYTRGRRGRILKNKEVMQDVSGLSDYALHTLIPELNTLATENEALTRRVAELELENKILRAQKDEIEEIAQDYANGTIEAITLDGSDYENVTALKYNCETCEDEGVLYNIKGGVGGYAWTEPCPDCSENLTASADDTEPVEVLDSGINEFMQASWDVADPKLEVVKPLDSEPAFNRYNAIEFYVTKRITVWDCLHNKDCFEGNNSISRANALWFAGEMNQTTCELGTLKPAHIKLPEQSVMISTTTESAPDA